VPQAPYFACQQGCLRTAFEFIPIYKSLPGHATGIFHPDFPCGSVLRSATLADETATPVARFTSPNGGLCVHRGLRDRTQHGPFRLRQCQQTTFLSLTSSLWTHIHHPNLDNLDIDIPPGQTVYPK
jgi:hypothetical protein